MTGVTSEDDQFPWHLGVFDAHCHPTDTISSLQSIPSMRARVLTVMATRAQDQQLVAEAAKDFGITQSDIDALNTTAWSQEHKILPAFGWHPWFSHQMFDESEYEGAKSLDDEQKIAHYQSVLTPRSEDYHFLLSLPDPRPFGSFVTETKNYLDTHPLALVGEVGLDRSFRIPEAWIPEQTENRDDGLTPGGREGRRLSPYRVSMDHQKKVLLAQLGLAGELQRAVSVHGVQAHGMLHETIAQTWKGHENKPMSKRDRKKIEAAVKTNADSQDTANSCHQTQPKPYPPRLCLHSFSGPAETVKQYTASSIPCEVFFSFSTSINAWSENMDGKVEAAVRAVPDEFLLVESDLHTAGHDMDAHLEQAVRKICTVRGWNLEDGVERLGRNWRRFAFGRT